VHAELQTWVNAADTMPVNANEVQHGSTGPHLLCALAATLPGIAAAIASPGDTPALSDGVAAGGLGPLTSWRNYAQEGVSKQLARREVNRVCMRQELHR